MIFWDVDTQVDFLQPGGKLYVPGAEQIVPNLARLTRWAREHAVALISSACAHHPGDPEFEVYGPHCLVGTRGQQKIPETLLPRRLVVPNRPTTLPNLRQFEQVIVEKDCLDVFTNPNIEGVLAQLSEKIPAQAPSTSLRAGFTGLGRGTRLDIVLYGVVTEICVAFAARGLLERGHHVHLVSDAVRHLDAEKAETLLSEICGLGAEVVTTDDIVGPGAAKVPAA